MKRYWALLVKETGNFYQNSDGVPFLHGPIENVIPPMTIPGTERVHVELRIVKYPDRKQVCKFNDKDITK